MVFRDSFGSELCHDFMSSAGASLLYTGYGRQLFAYFHCRILREAHFVQAEEAWEWGGISVLTLQAGQVFLV